MNGKNLRQVDGTFETGNTKHSWDLENMRNQHKVLAEYNYQPGEINRGYAGRTLYVNLTTKEIKEKPVTEKMKEQFTGGKGFGLKLLWDNIKPTTRWDSEENELVLSAGPLNGITQYSGMGKCLSVTVSPSTNQVCDSNAGGYFAPYLKFAGFDALEIQGKADEDVLVFIDEVNHVVTIETAPREETNAHILSEQLTDMYAEEDSETAKTKIAVVSAGRAAEHSYWGILNISFYDPRRKVARLKQHGRGGLGSVFRNKKLKALVARTKGFDGLTNDPANPDLLAEVGTKHHKQIATLDRQQFNMRVVGTGNIVEVMDKYDLLPTENFRYGSHPKAVNLHSPNFYRKFTQIIPDSCWYGCTMACTKSVDGFEVRTGPYKGQKVSVDGPEYENIGAFSNMGCFDPDWNLEWNFYCDTYGLDTISVGTAFAYYMEMYEYGILNRERCDGLEFSFGNIEAVMELMHRMAKGDQGEFVKVAAKGVRRVKDWLIEKGWGDKQLIEDCGMENKGLEYSEYVSKESLAQQGGYGLTNKGPQHDEAWLIFMDMVNNQIPTFADKAEALHYYPIWRTWFGLCGICKLPWNDTIPADNSATGDPAKVQEHVENYAQLMTGVLGKEIKPEDLIRMSEKVYNWQRAMNVWMGRGKRKDDWVPFRSLGPVTEKEYESRQERYDKQLVEDIGLTEDQVSQMPTAEKVKTMYDYRRNRFEKLTDAVYHRRGWTQNGVPTPRKLRSLGFGDETEMLEMLQKNIEADDAAGLNVWCGKYDEKESPPDPNPKYWEK